MIKLGLSRLITISSYKLVYAAPSEYLLDKAEDLVILKDFIKGILNICKVFRGVEVLKFPKKYHSKNA
ncbi:hypothetical protein AWW73_06070 [Acinetobacter lactucae]|nr:hypothetical protein APB94_06150 [Acinetobacter lactucae]KYQ78856.1 hypothetical protein AWW73_06070 [Acinetobacter lactucae]